MSHRADISKEKLLPLSHEQSDFWVAVKEWKYTGMVTDHLYTIETCQLCDQSQLRYHYEIVNRVTDNTLQVGSSCIKKFDITVLDEQGNELHGKERDEQLKKGLTEVQQEMMLNPIRQLWRKEESQQDYIQLIAEDFKIDGTFSPKRLRYLFNLMNKNDVEYYPHIYKINLRTKVAKEELLSMSEEDRELVWPSLTASQKQSYAKSKPKFDKEIEEEKRREEEKRKEEERYRLYQEEQRQAIRDIMQQKGDSSHQQRELPPHFKVHKVIFFDETDNPVDKIFIDDLGMFADQINQMVDENPKYNKVEVRLTLTDELVHTYPEED